MKEIRHYTKRISDFPRSLLNLDHLSPEALWNDTLTLMTMKMNHKQELNSISWDTVQKDKDLLGLHAILCHFFHQPEWKDDIIKINLLVTFLQDKLPSLATQVKPYTEWMSDGERTEELVRSLFSVLKILPANETEKYFNDRLRSLDTLERIKILEESRKAQERAQEILRKIKQVEEEEAASKYNRE
jgi:hypothetical protein